MHNDTHSDGILTVSQVAEILGISGRTVRRRIVAGTYPATKLPGSTGAYILPRGAFWYALERNAS